MIKQLLINQLDLPYEIHDIIKSFCFEEMYIKKIKANINKSILLIKNANPSRIKLNISDNNGHWAFAIDNVQMQTVNCRKCGNYFLYYVANRTKFNIQFSQNISCQCGHTAEQHQKDFWI